MYGDPAHFQYDSLNLVKSDSRSIKENVIKKQISSVVLSGHKWLEKVTLSDADGNPILYEFSKVEGGISLTPEESALLR